MTNQNEVTVEIEKSATAIATDVANQLTGLANLLETISADRYGLLITSLRWHSAQTASGDFTKEYYDWVATNLKYETP